MLPPKYSLGAVLAALLPLACACSSDEHGKTTPTDGSIAPDSSTAACAWAVRADKQTLNIAYPDTAATYWGISYSLAPGEALELHGRFPSARYASFISYEPNGGAIDVLTDRDIDPDPGSTNPFAGGATGGTHEYTFVIQGDEADGGSPNTLRARSISPSPPGDAGPPVASGAVLLGHGGPDGVGGTVLYRVYVPESVGDPTGGAGLPDVTLVANGSRRTVPQCESPGTSPAAVALVEKYGPPTDRPVPPAPIFIRPGADSARLFPNPDNVYIATLLDYQPGRVAVIAGTAPTFPDPQSGRLVGSGEQVRYWSLCTNEYRKPYPVSFCAVDRDVTLDATSQFKFVVSTAADRPTNATAANGVTWLDWGSTEVTNLLLLRHMLASPDFPESAINVAPGALAATTMGAYTPRGVYCDKAAFEQSDTACAP